MNNFCKYILWLFVFTNTATAQVSFSAESNNYLGVSSYRGATSQNAFWIIIAGNGNINIPNWKVTVQVVNPMVSSEGKNFPIDKLVLKPRTVTVQATPQNTPTIQQIGVLDNVHLSSAPVFLIPQSGAPVYNVSQGGYYRMVIYFDLVVEGGAYLGDLGPWKTYVAPKVQFTFYDGNNTFVGQGQQEYRIQVDPLSGTPPVQNNFSLTVNGGAQNGTLTLQSRSDYENGASVTYNNGLTVNTNTAYQVTVNANAGTPHFSYGNNNIDLDVLKVQLSTTASGVTELNPVILSTGAQRLAKGPSTNNQNVNFNVGYSINLAQKDKLLYAFKDKQQTETTYTTTLQYTILAQ